MKIYSEDNNKITYLETIKRTPYLITVSKNGDLLEVKEYISNSSNKKVSQTVRNVEFG